MPQRKMFLTAISTAAVSLFAGKRALAQTAPTSASPTPRNAAATAAPAAAAAATVAPAAATAAPAAATAAAAAAMRRFDPSLTDAQIATIAAGIEDSAKAGAALGGPKNRLRNGDEPATRFAVASE